ncbi:hypothetical protein AB0I39_01470 [Kitasatospora purpeofusca]
MSEIEDLFVKRAPHQEHRRLLFMALTLYMEQVRGILPTGAAWIDGGFCSYKSSPPGDVDVAILADPALLADPIVRSRLIPLRTHMDVHIMNPPLAISRLQPMGGLIDGYVIPAGDAALEAVWDNNWSRVMDDAGNIVAGAIKGYLEVIW